MARLVALVDSLRAEVARLSEADQEAEADDAHAHEEEGGGGFSVEEGYVEWVGLPGGLGLKLGKFFQQFGQLNRWHAHALPFQTRSFPHLAFIGEESLAQSGVSVHWRPGRCWCVRSGFLW